MCLGTNIYRLRTGRGLSQGDLAEALQVSRQSISKWETDGATPDLDKLVALCDLFGVTLDELVRGEVPAAGTSSPESRPEMIVADHRVEKPSTPSAEEKDSSTLRIVLICILVFLVLCLFASLLSPLLTGGLHFILIALGCFLFALRK